MTGTCGLGVLLLLGAVGCEGRSASPDPTGVVELTTSDEVYASQNGVNCSDQEDDAPELQALIDSTAAAGVGRRIILPSGTCVIGSTITFRDLAGATLRGQGAMATKLEWRGNATSPMVVLQNTRRPKLEDFAIVAGAPLRAAIRIQNGPGCTAGQQTCSSAATIRDVVIFGEDLLDDGIHVALNDVNGDNVISDADDVQNDRHRFENVAVRAYKRAAFALEGASAVALTFQDCLCAGMSSTRPDGDDTAPNLGESCVTTRRIANRAASFFWYEGASMAHTVADFDLARPAGAILISGLFSEKSNRFLETEDRDDPATAEFPLTLEGIRFGTGQGRLAADHEVIRFHFSGPLIITGGRWGAPSMTPEMKFVYDPPPSAPSAFVFTGNHVVGTDNEDKFPLGEPTKLSSNYMLP